ncbi:MAG: asparagine synthase (glutamine-hydrolyzing) [Candidatus Marinimicrobia bacterium]|nr:asparagine synthase (glutamine-hydrolyzing) [Candidatus Neomarinimicrobiota bacterium]
MCGILASFNNNHNKADYIKSLGLMVHRGPDNTGSYFNEETNTFLGQNRLAIIDLDPRSNQPFKLGNYLMVYNGEIYNYKELIIEHKLDVKTKSDTEVLLSMYDKYGPKCLDYFNGMFAFVIYDLKNKNFFVARDRLGIKPLYYRNIGNKWIFSSEISSLLSLEDSEFDNFGLRQYKKLRMTIKGYTVFKDIKIFPPGYFLHNYQFKQYWNFKIIQKDKPDEENLRWLIEDSVRLRKRSDVPVGAYLSGGLDSTILTALLRPDDSWTVGFKELNEFEWSNIANENIRSNHHQIVVGKKEYLDTAKWMIRKRREPLSVPNEVLIYLMTKQVKIKNTVVLSGEGADELFWGYDRIFKWANSAKVLNLSDFDKYYCYGSDIDNEIIDFALEGIDGDSVLDKIAYYFQIHHLQGLLRRLDNSTMLCSVEARVPFVDHRLVELLAGTPFKWKMGDSFKEPLKSIFADLLPSEIINRKKVGFPVPLDSVFPDTPEKETAMDSWLMFNINNFKEKFLD